MDRLGGMAVFAAVVEAKSFSAAARRLGVSKSAVSKQVARLEQRLGARLLNRTTRRLALTEAGMAFYEHCARILAEAGEAELAVTRLHGRPRGTIRINAPMTFGLMHIAPAVSDFLAENPELRVDMVLDDRFVDLIDEGFDVAVRIGALADSSLVARRLAPVRTVVCGAPDYFRRRGEPALPADLADHNCLLYAYESTAEWRFEGPDGALAVRVRGDFRANNGDALRAVALAGHGITLIPTFIVGEDLASGRLRTVLDDYRVPERAVHAVYPHRRYLSPKIRAFVDFFAARFGPEPYWDRGLGAQPKAR